MNSIIDYNQCKLCNKYIHKRIFNIHIKDCLIKNKQNQQQLQHQKILQYQQTQHTQQTQYTQQTQQTQYTPQTQQTQHTQHTQYTPQQQQNKIKQNENIKVDKNAEVKIKGNIEETKDKIKNKKQENKQLNEYQIQPFISQNSLVRANQLDNKSLYILFKKYDALFSEYISGKCIALVGPAQSIINTGKGEVIDKFDIVVRLNKSIPLPEGLEKDIGTRTDIIYNSLNTSDYPGENRFSTRLYKKYGVKFVSSSYPFNNDIFRGDILNYVYKYNFELPFKTFDDNKFNNLEKYLGTRPYTGTCAIFDLLSYPIKYLYITGLDFYHSKYYKEYREISSGQLKHTRNNNIHQARPQLNYLKAISLYDNRIILDNFLDNLLYENYYKFYKEFKKLGSLDIFDYGDEMIEKLFSTKKFNLSFTKNQSNILVTNQINKKENLPTIVFTNNYYYNNKDNEYALFISEKKDEINILNKNMNKKTFIGNFYYVEHRSIIKPSIYFNRQYLNTIKNLLKMVNIINCNTYLLLIISIMLYLPEKHYFSYNELIDNCGMKPDEKYLILFLLNKKKLFLIK